MVTAIALMNVANKDLSCVAQSLVDLPGMSEVHSVAGQYDLVGIMRTETNEEIADLVTNRINLIEGIERSETLMAFKVYSDFELEQMFAVGF